MDIEYKCSKEKIVEMINSAKTCNELGLISFFARKNDIYQIDDWGELSKMTGVAYTRLPKCEQKIGRVPTKTTN